MKAYKGFTRELKSVMGNGDKKTCEFKVGETKEVESSKTVQSGFHCCENPFECLSYYALGKDNRFFEVEAAGDIDEDESERIACTKITLVKELSKLEFVLAGIQYIVDHPQRDKWQQSRQHLVVAKDEAEAKSHGDIAIARGKMPKVKGPEGSILAMLVENESGEICEAKMFVAQNEKGNAGVWCKVGKGRKVEVLSNEEKAS